MTQHEFMQRAHILLMYLLGYHRGHQLSCINKSPVELATSSTVQHQLHGSQLAPGDSTGQLMNAQ